MTKVACSLLVAFSLAVSTASAAPRDARGRALELFEQSARAYREGRFQDAIDLLLEARRAKTEPVLLYNLGRAYEAIGKPSDAADAYAAYLVEDPRAADRGAIEGRITTLRAHAEQLEHAKIPPAEERSLPPSAPPVSAPPSSAPPPAAEPRSIVPWTLVAAGAVGIGTGVALGIVARGRHEDAVGEPAQAPAQEKQGEAESLATGATVALITGGALAGVGLAWLGIRGLSSSRTVSLIPVPGGATLTAKF